MTLVVAVFLLFAAIRRRRLPEERSNVMDRRILWNGKKCVHCGRCARECKAGVFIKTGDRIAIDVTKCTSCGICAKACPKGALELIPR